jgi:hypothetical protein
MLASFFLALHHHLLTGAVILESHIFSASGQHRSPATTPKNPASTHTYLWGGTTVFQSMNPPPLFFADARQRVKTRHETLYRCSRAWVVLAQAADSIVIMIPVPGSVRPTEARKFVSPSEVMMMSWGILGGAGMLYKALMVLQLAVRSFSQSMGTRDGLWMWSETNLGSAHAAPSRPWTACWAEVSSRPWRP